MDHYEIWCDLRETSRDREFCANVDSYLAHVQERGLLESWSLARRKLGFGVTGLGEFHITIDVRDMAQLEALFQYVATRTGEVERLHAAVFSMVRNAQFSLYRDFPDQPRQL